MKAHLPQTWSHTGDVMPLGGMTVFDKKGTMFGWRRRKGPGMGCFVALFPEAGGGAGGEGTPTFSGAGSCRWFTSRGVMRGTVWKPSSTEGGLAPFSPGALFSFTILVPFFPDLGEQWDSGYGRGESPVLSSPLGGFNGESRHWPPARFPCTIPIAQHNFFNHQNTPSAHRAPQPSDLRPSPVHTHEI